MPIRLAPVLLAATLAQAPGVLRWTPKEGDVVRFRTTGEFTLGGQQVALTTVNSHKVLRLDPNGDYLVEASPVEAKIVMGGQELPGQGVTTQTLYAANGEIKEIRGDRADATGYRMANLTIFHSPGKAVGVGDAWTADGKADAKTGAVPWKAEYKVVAEETVGPFETYRIDVTARETEATDAGRATGTVWVGKDGIVAQERLEWKGISVPGANAPVDGKYLLARLQ